MSVSVALPALAEADADDLAARRRAGRITRRAAGGIADQVQELAGLGLVNSATVEARTHSLAPTLRLDMMNGREAFFDFYPTVELGSVWRGVAREYRT